MSMHIKQAHSMKQRDFDLEIKAVDAATGVFKGYGSVFGNVDSYGEVVAPGAFKKSLAALEAKGRSVPILWQHKTDQPIGAWTSLKEDDHGLWGEGALWLDAAPNARIAQMGMMTKSITGLSIGFYTLADSYNEKTGIRTLSEIELIECSIVTNPANDAARIDSVKAKLARGEALTLPEFERILRDAGFSKSKATAIASYGFKQYADQRDADGINGICAALSNFKL